jgi:hypothetical protein
MVEIASAYLFPVSIGVRRSMGIHATVGHILLSMLRYTAVMRQFVPVVLLFLAAIFVSCHKSSGLANLSGVYMETSPNAGTSTLNFVDVSTVIVTGTSFF